MSENLASIVEDIKRVSGAIERGDTTLNKRIDQLEASINTADDATYERKSAVELCHNRRALTVPKIDIGVANNHTPASAETRR